jgi:hypothetical protein
MPPGNARTNFACSTFPDTDRRSSCSPHFVGPARQQQLERVPRAEVSVLNYKTESRASPIFADGLIKLIRPYRHLSPTNHDGFRARRTCVPVGRNRSAGALLAVFSINFSEAVRLDIDRSALREGKDSALDKFPKSVVSPQIRKRNAMHRTRAAFIFRGNWHVRARKSQCASLLGTTILNCSVGSKQRACYDAFAG